MVELANAGLSRDELSAWLRLQLTDGVGPATARRLLMAFGVPQDVFAQSRRALDGVVGSGVATALLGEPPGLQDAVQVAWDWLEQGLTVDAPIRRVIPLGDPLYPPTLLEAHDPPLLLYAMGRRLHQLAAIAPRAIAIVGSRNPTPQGTRHARQFAQALGQSGLVVVSGMALGVDAAAHEGALAVADGLPQWPATVAVVGTGLDRVYPKRHKDLAHSIAERGILLSEYALGTPPLAENFPRRNRILAALTRGTLVVEAALQSGSLITARLAVEQGRDVFAIPGSIDSPQSRGCHALIKQGARLVEDASDILDEWHWASAGQSEPTPQRVDASVGANPTRFGAIERGLGFEATSLDDLMARTGLDAAILQACLMEMELDGRVARLPGGQFQRIVSA
jgi:DNA processing protein